MKFVPRLTITVATVLIILWYLGGVSEIGHRLVTADPLYILLSFLVATADRAFMTFKWGLLLKSRGVRLPLFRGLKIYCTALLWGLILPSTIGADALRAYLTYRLGIDYKEIVASIIIERMVGFISVLLLGLLSFVILSQLGQLDDRFDPVWWGGGLLIGGATVAFALSFSRSLFDVVYGFMPRRLWHSGLGKRLRELHETYIGYSASRSSLAIFFGLTFSEQFLGIVFVWLTALAVGVDVGVLFLLGIFPIVLLVSRLPVSINGIGVFEGIFIMLMSLADVPAAQSVSIALLGRMVNILTWLPWWLAYVLETKQLRAPTSA